MMVEEAKKIPKDAPYSPGVKSKSIVHFYCGDQLRGKLPQGFTKPSMSIDEICHS